MIDRFSPLSETLRSTFESRFHNPLRTNSDRFIWDYWNVPGQYRLLRTPAEHLFGPKLYRQLQQELVLWGRQNLGCAQISPIWLSAYVDGFEQRLHCDNGHGPWAFVWSIGPKRPKFGGGQTRILKPEVLEFWKHHQAGLGLEEDQLFQFIEPKFNRLVVFDPRLPHGVETVRGVHDLLDARLVLHGWFTHPEPVMSTGVGPRQVTQHLERLMETVPLLRDLATDLTGTVCFRFTLGTAGTVSNLSLLTNTLRSRGQNPKNVQIVTKALASALQTWTFGKGRTGRQLILPLEFE